MGDDVYKLEELARAAGTSPRTVRYYVQRGLLPAPAFRGKDTAYGPEHLVRLRAIRQPAVGPFERPHNPFIVNAKAISCNEIDKKRLNPLA